MSDLEVRPGPGQDVVVIAPAGTTLGSKVTYNTSRTRARVKNTGTAPAPTPTPTTPVPSGPLVVTTSGTIIEGKAFTGTGYYGLHIRGTAAAPLRDVTVRRCTFQGFTEAIRAAYVTNLTIEDCIIDDPVYAGIMVLSSVGGSVARNTIRKVGFGQPANTNAYGIALSQQLPGTDPPTTDFVVRDNVIEDIPTWHGLDTHSGKRILWTGNVTRRCRSGIFVTGYTDLRSLDNDVNGNTFYAPTGADHYAVTSVFSTGGYVRNNTIVGWPAGREILKTSGGDADATALNLGISGNTIR